MDKITQYNDAQKEVNQWLENEIKKLLTPAPSNRIAPKKDVAQLHQELMALNEYLKTFVKNHPQYRTTLFNNAIETGYLYFSFRYQNDLYLNFSITNKCPVSSGKIKVIMQIDWKDKSFSEEISDRLNIVYDYLALLEQILEKFDQLFDQLSEMKKEADDEKRRVEVQQRIQLVSDRITLRIPILKNYSHYIERNSNSLFDTSFQLVIKMSEMINVVVYLKYESIPIKLITQILETIKQSESLENKVEKMKEKLIKQRIAYLSIDSKQFNDVDNTRAVLKMFFPDSALEEVASMLEKYPVHLNVRNVRVRGSYYWMKFRFSVDDNHYHEICINLTISNKYEFLWIFLHEYAHLLVQVNYGRLKQSHGIKWKETYKQLLLHFIQLNIFPEDIRVDIQRCIERGITRYD